MRKKAIIITLVFVALCIGAAGTMKEECDHCFVTEVTVAATETKEGVRTSTCSKCGAVVASSVPKLSAGFTPIDSRDVISTNDDVMQFQGQIGESQPHDNPSGGGQTFGSNKEKHDSNIHADKREEKRKEALTQEKMASRDTIEPESAEKLREALASFAEQCNAGVQPASYAVRLGNKSVASRSFDGVFGNDDYLVGRNRFDGRDSNILFTVTDEFIRLTAYDEGSIGDAALDSC